MPDALLCRVVGLQFGLQTLFTSPCPFTPQSGPTRQVALRPFLTKANMPAVRAIYKGRLAWMPSPRCSDSYGRAAVLSPRWLLGCRSDRQLSRITEKLEINRVFLAHQFLKLGRVVGCKLLSRIPLVLMDTADFRIA
jgi:hypothetical protein